MTLKNVNGLFTIRTMMFISRIFVGLVFIFSGFVKGIDPLGTTYKFHDYFDAFGLSVFTPMAFYLSLILNLFEFIIGVALLVGYRMKIFSWMVFTFMCIFLPLTLYIAIFDPVADCGCFGDALIVSNWETFWKNVVFMFFVLFILKYRNRYHSSLKPMAEWGYIAFVTIIFGYISVQGFRHLPMMDFRPYSIGANFEEGMRIPKGAPQDEYETIFYYRNLETGKVKRFTSENYPWQDTLNWEFESYDTRLLKKGYSPSIENFSLQHERYGDVTNSFITGPGQSFLVVAYDLQKADEDALIRMNAFAEFAKERDDFSFYATTASSGRVVERTIEQLGLVYDFYATDEITQKTIIRSNPGLLFVFDGTILGKWHFNDFPDISYFDEYVVAKQVSQLRKQKNHYLTGFLFFGLLIFSAAYHKLFSMFRNNS